MSSAAAVLWKQCDEVVLALRVDPGDISDFVGSDFSLALDGGRARVVIMAQDCSQYWLDGVDLGPAHFVHVLVAIEGPQEVRPVVGAQRTLPSRRWFSLFTGSTNRHGREGRNAIGSPVDAIGGVSLDVHGSGRVDLGAERFFAWSLSAPPSPVSIVGVDHDVYSRNERGEVALKRIQAIGRMVGEPTRGVLRAPNGVEPSGLVPAGAHPVLGFAFLPVWARGELGETTR